MENLTNPVCDKNTIEFATVALEYCTFIESAQLYTLSDFVDKTLKLLPLLYLKGSLLPEVDINELDEPYSEGSVTEDMYELVRGRVATLLGKYDSYLDVSPDSDLPVIAFVSENMADVYQDIGNFVALYREGYESAMKQAVSDCFINWEYWGQQVLNVLKALHSVRWEVAEKDNNDDEIDGGF